jgi:hypothetical protein
VIFAGKPIQELAEADIRTLIEREVGESRILDYKREMYSNSDADKRDLACDISAFANSNGGFLIVGIECDEENNKPVEVVGVDNNGLEARIESVCLDRIDEPLSNGRDYRLEIIPLANTDHVVLVIQIFESLRAPHMVSFQKQRYFYVRHGRQSRPADINDLRALFEKVQGYMSKAEIFIAERKARPTNPNGDGFGWATLSVVPLMMRQDVVKVDRDTTYAWFNRAVRHPRAAHSVFPNPINLQPSRHGFSYEDRRNAAGRVSHRLVVFRNGSVELGMDLLNPNHPNWCVIPTSWLEPTFLDALYFAGQLYQFCDYYGEVRVLMRFIDAQGSTLPMPSQPFGESELEDGVDTTSIQLFDQPEIDLKRIMKRLFNAFGLYQSLL